MGKYAFIHISDIHISDFEEKYTGKKILSNFSKYSEYEKVFIEDIEEYSINNELELKTIIISGDLANNGKVEDYEKVSSFLNTLKNKFNLNSTDILIVPGNHDINWFTNEKAWEEDSKKKDAWEYQEEKFKDFKNFFDNFYKHKDYVFNPNNAITIIKPYDDRKLCFVGINSCYKESFLGKNHFGYIEEKTLDQQLSVINEKYTNYGIIAFFHHNPYYVDRESKTLKNWANIRNILSKYNIYNYLFGHQHKDESKKITEQEEFCFFSIGSLGKIITDGNNSYNLFIEKEISESKLHFERQLFKFMPDPSDKYLSTGYWEKQDSIKDYKDLIVTTKKGYIPPKTSIPSPKTSPLNIDYVANESFEEEIRKGKESTIKNNEDEIINIIKKDELVKSGHFHWSGNRKTRTWIDTTKLFSSKNVLDIIRNDFIEKIKRLKEENNIESIDLIMGLGIEGNIIASPLGIVFSSYYSYYPVPTRTDHNEFEKQIINGRFKNIVLITDVVFEGSTIIEFINKNVEFFKNVENLIIMAVFFTGDKNIYENFKNEINKKIIFRYLTDKIKIEKCNIDTNKCSIYKLKLETIYEF